MGESELDHVEAAGIKVDGVPQWAGYLVIVALFLGYLIKSNERDDLVAAQRIERCHGLQAESNTALRELRDALTAHALACDAMHQHNLEVLRRLDGIDRRLEQ